MTVVANVRAEPDAQFDWSVPVVIIGAGACGSVAALAAHDAGAEVLVVERDVKPSGSTAMSSGLIPACGTEWQQQRGVTDNTTLMANDILAKSHQQASAAMVGTICGESGPTLHWLHHQHDIEFTLIEGFTYPGHSALRMHAHIGKTGASLMSALGDALNRAGIPTVTGATVETLVTDGHGRVLGIEMRRPDGAMERLGCTTLVLACNGYGGNPTLVAEHIPEMQNALYFGHTGNQGHAVLWGEELGAELADLGAYQGHGSVASPHGALITWAVMMSGGIQLNTNGKRFSNEHLGYSEQAVEVIAQPRGLAWNVYGQQSHELALEFEDYRDACAAGAVISADSQAALADAIGAPAEQVSATLAEVAAFRQTERADPFGRDFSGDDPLEPPYRTVRVTGALFHTQGGLQVDHEARVQRPDGSRLPNLFAGGGAARGVSGAHVYGYLSGNGLLSAVTLGRLAGHHAGRLAMKG